MKTAQILISGLFVTAMTSCKTSSQDGSSSSVESSTVIKETHPCTAPVKMAAEKREKELSGKGTSGDWGLSVSEVIKKSETIYEVSTLWQYSDGASSTEDGGHDFVATVKLSGKTCQVVSFVVKK